MQKMPNYEVYKKKEVIAISPVEICMAMDGNWKRRRESFTCVDIENAIKK